MRYQRKQGILIEPVGKNAVVFDQARRVPFAVNRIAADILMDADGSKSIEEIAEAISGHYREDPSKVLADTRRILDEMEVRGLAERID